MLHQDLAPHRTHRVYWPSFAVLATDRAHDQVRNTVCDSGLNVKICPTSQVHGGRGWPPHQPLEDIA